MAFPNPHTRLFLFAKENGERRKWHSEKIERIQEWECRLPISALSRSEMDHVFKARLDLHGQTSFYSTEKVGRVGRRWDSVSWLRKLINIGKHVKHMWIGQHMHGWLLKATQTTVCAIHTLKFLLKTVYVWLLVYNCAFLSPSFVDCKECGRKMHQICVLHYDIIWPAGWVIICDLWERGAAVQKSWGGVCGAESHPLSAKFSN